MQALIDQSYRRLKQEQDVAGDLVAGRAWYQIGALTAAFLVTAALVWFTAHTVRTQTNETIETVRAIAAGDYARRMDEGDDEFGRIGRHVNELAELLRQMAEVNKSQAIIEFRPDGTIVSANAKFLQAVGYSADELRGQHHRMFADAAYAASPEYRDFWARLGRGEVMAASSSASARAARRCGCRRRTTRSWTAPGTC